MKTLLILLLTTLLYGYKDANTDISEESFIDTNYLWKAEWTNGIQNNPKEMTKTVCVLLSNTDKKKAICDENNLVITSVYLELHYNDHTVENTVWSLSDEDREIVKTN
jgi:hypothetical protein